MRRRAFSLTELFVGITILGILAGAFTLRPKLIVQTARREADRIVSQLYRFIDQAEHNHLGFRVVFNGSTQSGRIKCVWIDGDPSLDNPDFYLEISKGCTIENLNNLTGDKATLNYSIVSNGFLPPSMTLQVTGADGSIRYIVIYVPGTRIRISDTRP